MDGEGPGWGMHPLGWVVLMPVQFRRRPTLASVLETGSVLLTTLTLLEAAVGRRLASRAILIVRLAGYIAMLAYAIPTQ